MTCAPFSSEVWRKLKKCTLNVMFKWNWRETLHVHADLDMVCHSQRFLKFPDFFPDQLNNDGLNSPLTGIPSIYSFKNMLSVSHVQCASGLIHNIWKYRMKRFIWGTRTFCATGVNVEWRSKKLQGEVRGHLSPGKFYDWSL